MMTNRLEVSILAAPLAAIDRRALSQAWYSALRLAPQPAPASLGPPRRRAGDANGAGRPGGLHGSRSVKAGMIPLNLSRGKSAVTHAAREGAGGLRRVPRGARLAERIERRFADPQANPKRATFAVGLGNARVHVVLQTSGGRTTLLALCKPEVRILVARALIQARTALAARGVGIEFCAIGPAECS